MSKLKIKIIVGFRKEQHYTIDADEAHKAYYLFLNPEQRGIFSNGVAVIGQDIHSIEPDYNAMLEYSPSYTLDGSDWQEVKKLRLDTQVKEIMLKAKEIAQLGNPQKINLPLSKVLALPKGEAGIVY